VRTSAVVQHYQVKRAITSGTGGGSVPYGTSAWTSDELYSFLHHTVRSFLRNDLYSALTELLSRAEGSFGVTAYR
jgi:hypothetical protein